MTTEAAILNNVRNLPESVKQAVLLYTDFLASQYAARENGYVEAAARKSDLFGSMKGTFVLPLPDDFDEPLECFEEYM